MIPFALYCLCVPFLLIRDIVKRVIEFERHDTELKQIFKDTNQEQKC